MIASNHGFEQWQFGTSGEMGTHWTRPFTSYGLLAAPNLDYRGVIPSFGRETWVTLAWRPTVAAAQSRYGKSNQANRNAISRLCELGLLEPYGDARYDRLYWNRRVFEVIEI